MKFGKMFGDFVKAMIKGGILEIGQNKLCVVTARQHFNLPLHLSYPEGGKTISIIK